MCSRGKVTLLSHTYPTLRNIKVTHLQSTGLMSDLMMCELKEYDVNDAEYSYVDQASLDII